jgi:hypothetical protein
MNNNWQSQQSFGLSWGVRGFRIGKSQYGTWWISVGLPFGFRITRRIGRQHDPITHLQNLSPQPLSIPNLTSVEHLTATTNNRKILEEMRKKK